MFFTDEKNHALVREDIQYVIRGGEEYDVKIKRITRTKIYAEVLCLRSERKALFAYDLCGNYRTIYRDDDRLHALDLIAKDDWHTGFAENVTPLPLPGHILRISQIPNVMAKVLRVSSSLKGDVVVAFFDESTGLALQESENTAKYLFDATVPRVQSSLGINPNLVRAYQPYETWKRGDPLWVRFHNNDRRPSRFSHIDENGNVVVYFQSASDPWLYAHQTAMTVSAFTQIALISEDDNALSGPGLTEEVISGLKEDSRRMRRSWPYEKYPASRVDATRL